MPLMKLESWSLEPELGVSFLSIFPLSNNLPPRREQNAADGIRRTVYDATQLTIEKLADDRAPRKDNRSRSSSGRIL